MLITAAIKVVFDIVYECVDDTSAVEWSIAYNFIDYAFISASLMLTSFITEGGHEIPKWVERIRRIAVPVCVVLSIGYWVVACIELTYIGSTREIYDAHNGGGFFSSQGITAFCSLVFYTWLYLKKTKNETIKWI